MRAADGRPYELQDLLPSDTRFKVLVFAGNTVEPAQMERVRALATQMARPEGFLERFGRGEPRKVFDVLSISSAKKQDTNYTGMYDSSGVCPSNIRCTNAVLYRPATSVPPTLVQVRFHFTPARLLY